MGADGLPSRVALGSGVGGVRGVSVGAWLEVEAVEEVWRVGEAWWRETPIGRTYYRVIVDGGRTVTLFRDEFAIAPPRALEASAAYEVSTQVERTTSMWFEQHY